VIFDQQGQEIIGWGATSTEYNIGGALDRPVPGKLIPVCAKLLWSCYVLEVAGRSDEARGLRGGSKLCAIFVIRPI
jgi:hypothetical protein